MRYHWMSCCALVLTGVLFTGVAPLRAQPANYDFSGVPADPVPLPLGPIRASDGGFYTAIEAVIMRQSRAIGSQTLAVYGFRDSIGIFTGVPGTFVGSGAEALNSGQTGKGSFQPGFDITIGYRSGDGIAVSFQILELIKQKYFAGASGPGNNVNPGGNNENTFLYSPVFNFTPFFSGPSVRTAADVAALTAAGIAAGQPTGSLYGIWNGATYESISYEQRFTQSDITVRAPILETDYSRTYALGGARFAWFFERFQWRATAVSADGSSDSEDAALYTNTLSQRMYGAFLGCGNEVYLGSRFAASLDATGALLIDVIKERAKYERQDKFTESKAGRNDYTVVPNINLKPSVWWYPIKGVECRLSYNAQFYFYTEQMDAPVGFDFGSIDPAYNRKTLRYVQGIEGGIGITF